MSLQPKLVVITGRAGSGKTTFAKKLGEYIYFPVLARDEIKEGYVNTFNVSHTELPDSTNKVVTDTFFKTIELLLSNKVSLIAEAAFQHKVWEPQIATFRKYAKVFLIIAEIEATIAAERHLKRGLDDHKRELFHGDNRVTHFKETGVALPPSEYEAPSIDVPTIKVSTLGDYEPSIEEIAKQIQEL